MAQAAAVTLVTLVAGFAGEVLRHPDPAAAAPAGARAMLPVLPLVQRFKVGQTCNDIAVLPRSHVLVIAQSAGGRAVVVDEGTGRQLALLRLFSAAFHVAVDPALGQIYLPDEYSGRLVVVRQIHGWAQRALSSVRVGLKPHGVAVNLRTHRVYVGDERGGTLSIIAGASLRVQAKVHVGRGPGGVGVAPAARLVYVVLVDEDRVVVLDAATGNVLRSIPVGKGPTHLAVDAASGRAAVVNTTAGTLSVVDGLRGTAASPIPVGPKPYNVALDSARGLIFVASATVPRLTIVASRPLAVRGTMRLDMVPGALAVDPVRRLLIVGGATRPWVEIFSYHAL